jgi:signal transduction histidine kinase
MWGGSEMSVDASRENPETAFFAGGGQLGTIIAAFDWSKTPLGPIETWPTSIKTTVGLILRSPVPIVTLWGEQGTMIYNDAYSGFAGGRHPRLLGSAVREGWPEVADFNDNVMKVGLSGGSLSYTDQELTLHRSGAPEQVWMNLDYSPVIGESGQPIGVIAIVVESTAKVLMEREIRNEAQRFREALDRAVVERTAALQQSEKTIRTVFETSYMSQGLLTTDGKIVYVNATSLASIKRRLEDVVGKDFADTPWFTGTPGMPDKIRDGIARVAAGESIRIAMPLHLPTGDRIFEFSMRPALDENGKVVALVPEAVEITARVRAEEALQQAVKLEAIGNLTGGIAHDFNNLLMAILGSLELLRKRLPDDPATLRLIDNAAEGARRGKSLTERMLAFARKQDLKPQRTDLGRLVGGMAELLERALGPTITVDIKIDSELSQVEIDPNQMEAALLNLAVNARDAMHGQGPLVIQAREDIVEQDDVLSPGRYVVLAVIDAGEGMDHATLKRATEPFFTTKGVGKGTGLGLSMVQGLAEQSGGRLMLKSLAGVGTTAEIWLPAAGPAAAQPLTEPVAPVAASENQGTASLNILAVDDDPLILMNIVDMLEDLGHSVTEASSAKRALGELERAKFDLMVTDHAMPHMTGAQLIKEAQARWPELRVILATGYAELPPGANVDVPRLSKPFAQSDLAAALAKA